MLSAENKFTKLTTKNNLLSQRFSLLGTGQKTEARGGGGVEELTGAFTNGGR